MRRAAGIIGLAFAVLGGPALAAAAAPAPKTPPAAKPPQAAAPAASPASAGGQLFVVEQLITPTLKPEVMEQLKPLHTILQIEELFKSASIPFQWQRATFDPAKVDPKLLAQIQALPPGEVFVLPAADRVYINRIIGRADPPKPNP